MTVSLCLSSILLAIGVLPFFGLLAGNVSVTGTMVNWWAIIFVTTCGLVTLGVYITAFVSRTRREQLLRSEGRGMEGEAQSVRSRPLPVPKEVREEE
jgi:membrane protein implicated in regulation of membrane protease activity